MLRCFWLWNSAKAKENITREGVRKNKNLFFKKHPPLTRRKKISDYYK